jgi:hypothetical protein
MCSEIHEQFGRSGEEVFLEGPQVLFESIGFASLNVLDTLGRVVSSNA